ncbi:proton-translocating NADH-quinone oxidoreductase, chain L [Desulfovibrio sp. X2]|uniref:NADH-quinone oxidoreductase subunit L n=1 Tax=Desulfovibrio sp. X2 TaxID=941449 RepID=UPI000358A591|nr:NADH-quinone oxidoreductase subunit L [Desulfovibrio sp. X2]EPR43567.1 proton-translocating NADH-quinone oxidoreductase, chain L [Desulfovibrio sp. X2]
MKTAVALVLLFPLLGAAWQALFARGVPRRTAQALACLAVFGSLCAAVAVLSMNWGRESALTLLPWFSVGSFSAAMDVLLDPLSGLMAVMVTFVSLIIHVYSAWYMREDESYVRYFCYLNLFVFFMLVITLADNLVFLFLGWEGVGFCSYALIGFWYLDDANTRAGRKAFILTRIGDVAFLVAIAVLVSVFGTPSIARIVAGVSGTGAALLTPGTATLLGLLLLWAATGKSAQMPLLVWLPDAMAGPTPVSALIHAATMVTAGVYLLMRLFPLLALSHTALLCVAAVGAFTALFASCAALGQRDIKRILAWSTISQVGYMFLGIGAGTVSGAMFHLLSHAFFKSLLFMGAGCVIQALHEEHDVFRMGRRVRTALPWLYWVFLCGCLALAGVPPVSGFFSKGGILLACFDYASTGGGAYTLLWLMGTAAAFLTAVYTFRLFFLAFTGTPALSPGREAQKIPGGMTHVLWPLAVLSVVGGVLNLPEHGWLDRVIGGGLPHAAGASVLGLSPALVVDGLDTLLVVAGILTAWHLFGPRAARTAPSEGGLRAFAERGLGLDGLYRNLIARPYLAMAPVMRGTDERGVDAAAEGTGRLAVLAARAVRPWATGRLSYYLAMLLLGLAFILAALAGRVI